MRNPLLEFYSDYLISSFALATTTGLSRLLDNAFSHDQITRFLSGSDYTSRDLWGLVKPAAPSRRTTPRGSSMTPSRRSPTATRTRSSPGILATARAARSRGVNLLNCLYHAGGVSVPVAFEIVHKDLQYCEVETKRLKRQSSVTKNERLRQMLRACQQNELQREEV